MNVMKDTSPSPIVRCNCTICSEDDVVLTESWIIDLASLAVKFVKCDGIRHDVSDMVSTHE
jgi:hypothetical protein